MNKKVILTGAGIYLTYLYPRAQFHGICRVLNIGYVVAFRQLSNPLGAILGLVILREKAYVPKLLGIAAGHRRTNPCGLRAR